MTTVQVLLVLLVLVGWLGVGVQEFQRVQAVTLDGVFTSHERSMTIAPDMGGDGVEDLVLVFPRRYKKQTCRLEVRSGRDLSVLKSVPMPAWHGVDDVIAYRQGERVIFCSVTVLRDGSRAVTFFDHESGKLLSARDVGMPSDNNYDQMTLCALSGDEPEAEGQDSGDVELIVVGVPQPTSGSAHVLMLSADTGELLGRVEGEPGFGATVAAVGDLDQDGREDYCVFSLPLKAKDKRSRVQAFSGRDGELIWDQAWGSSRESSQCGLTRLGDVDGDGVPDVCLSWHRSRGESGQGLVGSVDVVSGRTGVLLFHLSGETQCSRFGWRVVPHAAGEDSAGAFLVSAPSVPGTGECRKNVPYISWVAGEDGELMATLEGEPGSMFGWWTGRLLDHKSGARFLIVASTGLEMTKTKARIEKYTDR